MTRQFERRWLSALWTLTLLCSLSAALGPAQAQAQAIETLDLELAALLRQRPRAVPREIEVSTAARISQSAADAPAVTYVLTSGDIERYGLRNMEDILRTMPGLYTTSDTMFTYVGARGLGRSGDYNARLLFLIDGVRVNENIYDAGLLGGEFFVDVDLIERVEYAPGPGSPLYGNNAFFGVINVITKRGDKLRGGALHFNRDTAGVQTARARWGHRAAAGWEAWLGVSESRQQRKPWVFVEAQDHVDEQRDLFWMQGQRVFGSFNAGGLALRAGMSRHVYGLPEYIGGSQPDPPVRFGQNRNVALNHLLALSCAGELGPNLDWHVAASLKRSGLYWRYPFEDEAGQRQDFDGRSLGA
ncbi:MAG: TonB-dependent receptor plug domain-containing protein [Ideonella sp.]|nr:TonB-dependent receptor plug domain-containing protein [Ideonella sp.]